MQDKEVGEPSPAMPSRLKLPRRHLRQHIAALAAGFFADRRGNVLIFTALGVFALVGAVGLGTGASAWYAQQRLQQNAADVGAESGVLALQQNLNTQYNATYPANGDTWAKAEAKSAASTFADSHGFTDGVDGASVTVKVATTDSITGYTASKWNHKAIEVYITKPASTYFASLFLASSQLQIAARSVAILDYSEGGCMLALGYKKTGGNTTNNLEEAFQAIGSPNVNVTCGIIDNSSATSGGNARNNAFYIQGGNNVQFSGSYISIDGGLGTTGSATTGSNTKAGTGSQFPDPYSGWSDGSGNFPTPSGTNRGSFSDTQSSITTLQPGIYSSVTINGTATLSPGTYFVEGGNFTVNGNIANSPGVTIVLTGTGATPNTSTSVGVFTMGNNATAVITAPVTGSSNATGYAGIVLAQSRNAPLTTLDNNGNCSLNCNVLQGGPNSTFTGAIYMPQGTIDYHGNSGTAVTGCTQFIGNALMWEGNGAIAVNNCDNTGVIQFGAVAHLVE